MEPGKRPVAAIATASQLRNPGARDRYFAAAPDALSCLHQALATATRLTGLDDLREDLARAPVSNLAGQVIGHVLVPLAIVSDNGSCFCGETFAYAFIGDEPLLRNVRSRVRPPQTNGVVERFIGTLEYEHL